MKSLRISCQLFLYHTIVTKSELEFKEIKDVLHKVMDSFSGEMMITITADGVKFDLSNEIYYNIVRFCFDEIEDKDENAGEFFVASRWIYENYAYV